MGLFINEIQHIISVTYQDMLFSNVKLLDFLKAAKAHRSTAYIVKYYIITYARFAINMLHKLLYGRI